MPECVGALALVQFSSGLLGQMLFSLILICCSVFLSFRFTVKYANCMAFFLVNYGNLIVALASYMAGKAQFS